MNFAELFKSKHEVCLHVSGLIGRGGDAEDICASAFMKAFVSRSRFRRECSAMSWIKTIAKNEALYNLRRKPMQSIEEFTDSEFLIAPPQRPSDYSHELAVSLSKLNREVSEILIAHYVYNVSIKELSRRDKIPAGTVLSRLFTARKELRKQFAKVTKETVSHE